MSIWADLSMIFPFGLWLLLKQFILSTLYSDNISEKEKKKMLIFEIFFQKSVSAFKSFFKNKVVFLEIFMILYDNRKEEYDSFISVC